MASTSSIVGENVASKGVGGRTQHWKQKARESTLGTLGRKKAKLTTKTREIRFTPLEANVVVVVIVT
jgi:hypothetical protein